jgi:hypothetical protein
MLKTENSDGGHCEYECLTHKRTERSLIATGRDNRYPSTSGNFKDNLF